jgi:hypothetical protein
MSLVGDIILDLRARIPDAPSVLNPPVIASITPTTVTGGVFTPGSTHYFTATGTNTWGETTPAGPPQAVTFGAGQNAVLVAIQAAPPPLYENINVYETGTLGGIALDQWIYPIPAGQSAFTLTVATTVPNHTGGPPQRATSFNPDTDGNFIGAYTAYRLLNRALQEMVRIAGGIIDVTGVQSNINQSMYRLASPFYTFINAWYDGYPIDIVPRSFMYLRNSAAGFSGILSYEQDGPQSVIQVWPQSNRTGGQNQLAGNIDANTNSFQLFAGASNFLSIGLAQIDNEVVAYSSVTQVSTGPPPFDNLRQFNGVTRGMGGTDAVAHSANAPVTELNIRLSGYRMCETYSVGQSLNTLMVPQAWETPLVLHMLSQVRSMEQDDATAEKLLADFTAQADKIAKQSRLGKIKPRQIPVWGQNNSDARNVNGIGFGWLIN